MDYLFISKFNNNKMLFVTCDGNAIKPNLGSSEPRLMAICEHDIVLLTKEELGKEVFDSLYDLSESSTEFISPCFSFKKGEETNLAEKLGKSKYAFAYLDSKFKYYDRHAKAWRTVRHAFENEELELAFKSLAQKGSFILGLDKLSIEDFFNANDVLNA